MGKVNINSVMIEELKGKVVLTTYSKSRKKWLRMEAKNFRIDNQQMLQETWLRYDFVSGDRLDIAATNFSKGFQRYGIKSNVYLEK